jgi:ATP-dependent RNA helicase RhlE
MKKFSDLGLNDQLQRAVLDAGYSTPTPIQQEAIPHLLAGHDLLGCAQTGTGKTAAFALPILQRLASSGPRTPGRGVRALVLVPTRELAAQVAESFHTYGGARSTLSVAVIFGGVGQAPQVNALKRGVDILVATPGRLIDLMGQRHARLDHVEVLVLDEADHMLDLGFIPDVRRILAVIPRKRQTLLFSATMPPTIAALADSILTRPIKVSVTPQSTTVAEIRQSVHFVGRYDKAPLLARLLGDPAVERALVFTRTKRGADRVARRLVQDGIPAEAIHGNKSQNNRERTMDAFRGGHTRVLVATDIAARGIDVDAITHVIQYELPNVPETYVHRIGRTGRAGASGVAIALVDAEERTLLRDIERLIKREVPVAGGARGEPVRDRDARSHERNADDRRGPPQRDRSRQPQHANRGGAKHGHGQRSRPGEQRAPRKPGEHTHASTQRSPTHARPQPGSHQPHRPPSHAPRRPQAPARKHTDSGGGHKFGTGVND